MKFHLIAGTLLLIICLVFYKLIAGMQEDFATARPQIQKESFKAATEQMKAPTQEIVYFNKEISKIPTQPAEPPATPKTPAAAVLNPTQPEPIEARINGDEFWCRSISVKKEKNPVKCLYPDACYGCAGSGVIPPEYEGTTPFCENGEPAKLYHVECCPSGLRDGDILCPDVQECLHADTIPDTFCSCDNRPECRYVVIGSKVECTCIQR